MQYFLSENFTTIRYFSANSEYNSIIFEKSIEIKLFNLYLAYSIYTEENQTKSLTEMGKIIICWWF